MTTESEDPTREWQRKVLYFQRIRTDLSNERKYVSWLGVSIALISLGFVVERLDYFLAAPSEQTASATGVLPWASRIIFALGCLTIVTATWEFFADRRRIAAELPRSSRTLIALMLTIAVTIIVIAALLPR
jgi:uncharacterized membrane protein YidH (DUF202 family)